MSDGSDVVSSDDDGTDNSTHSSTAPLVSPADGDIFSGEIHIEAAASGTVTIDFMRVCRGDELGVL